MVPHPKLFPGQMIKGTPIQKNQKSGCQGNAMLKTQY